jgi:hypothetical protein
MKNDEREEEGGQKAWDDAHFEQLLLRWQTVPPGDHLF